MTDQHQKSRRLLARLRITRRFCRQIWRSPRCQGLLISLAAGIVKTSIVHLLFSGTPWA